MNATFGKKKLVRDISANTLQTVITQVFGLVIFYLTSKYLSKDDFGQFNWSMAVGSTIIAIASLGLDLVFVKRIASGENVLVLSGIHFFHTLLVGIVLSAGVFCIKLFIPSFSASHPLFFLIFLNLALANIANSFKLCLNGLEAYKQLAILALSANVLKLSGILLLYVSDNFSIMNVILVYTATSFAEFILGYFIMSKNLATRMKPLLKVVEYKYFILESLPQLGVVLFDSALARIDWILLGIISTAAATAEYSFAYKIFELSKLPLLIVAPVLLTRFSKIFAEALSETHKKEIRFFLKLEMFIVMLIPIGMVCLWTPLIDFFTNDKYGKVNEINYAILALCVPVHGIINFLWTLGFVQGQLKTILYITVTVSVLNIISNSILIPVYGTLGASLAFLFCTLIQLILYLKYIRKAQVQLDFKNIIITFFTGLVTVVATKIFITNVIFAFFTALSLYVIIMFATKQVSMAEIKKTLLKR